MHNGGSDICLVHVVLWYEFVRLLDKHFKVAILRSGQQHLAVHLKVVDWHVGIQDQLVSLWRIVFVNLVVGCKHQVWPHSSVDAGAVNPIISEFVIGENENVSEKHFVVLHNHQPWPEFVISINSKR